ncbi:MAG: vWA domain-containing protein [Polyangiales bacterium]
MRASFGVLMGVAALACLAGNASAQIPGLPPLPSALPGLPPLPGVPSVPGAQTKTAKITSAKNEGDLKLSAGIGVDVAGSLVISMAAIKHPDLPNVPVSPLLASLSISASVSGSLALSCSIGGVSASSRAPVDLVFINDTTGSMSGTVNGISDSIKTFAQKIQAGGVDARFSMYTYGDAWATKGSASKFTVGVGDFDPPSFDNTPRPYVGLTELPTFEKFLAEMKGSGALGVGGGDSPENTLGALNYASSKVSWRQGAAHVFVVIGDNPAHQKASANKFGGNWIPPNGDDLVSDLNGKAVAHVVAHDKGTEQLYNLKKLADGTGGNFKDLPKDGKVDLTTVGIDSFLLSGYRGTCTGLASGSIDLVIQATVVGKKIYTGSLAFKVVVS